VAAPLGLLATGTAWGEWGAQDLGGRLGFVPEGVDRFGGLWSGVLPDYALPGRGSGPWAVLGYLLSALAGVALLVAGTWLVVRLRRRRSPG